jgi:PAS domain S-box-containing protein
VSHETSNSSAAPGATRGISGGDDGLGDRVTLNPGDDTIPDDGTSAVASWRRGALANWALADPIATVALASALVSFLVAALLAPKLSALVFAGIGAALGFVSLHLSLRPRANRDAALPASLADFAARLERRLEQLQDAQWQLDEKEQRYRALLDAQEDMILRRDAGGRLTFVNRPFLRNFAVSAEDVLGKPFDLETCDGDDETPLATTDGIPRKRFTQCVRTAAGERWIEWEERLVPASDGIGLEVQSVGRDITDQRHVEAQLAEARDQAEAANRAKSRFLAAMSHEIRTPMNGIMGMASLLIETQQTPEQQTYARAIDQSARTLLALIDEILDFSKIEAGKLELAEAPFALEACIQGAVELLAPRAHEKGLEIAWSVDPELPPLVSGDETRVRQILLNLLSNAVKFTDNGGVSVSAAATKDADGAATGVVNVEISVEDTGIGMSPEDMQVLFAEFEQADAAVRRRDGGTGLGLAISMQLVRAMGGDINVVTAPGKGSTFVVNLVLKRLAVAEGSDRAMITALGRVLLAFDRPLERRALAYALSSTGVATAESDFALASAQVEAAAAKSEPFDRIVVDGAAGALAAGRLLDEARRLNPQGLVRGIVLVNVLARASLAEFRAAGFDSYLVRPVRPASMLMQLGLRAPAIPARDSSALAEVPRLHAAFSVQRRVLLAEDNEINSLLAKRVLEKCGCEYVAVTNGHEAVMAVVRTLDGDAPPIDLVLMDIFMPQLDGIEATRKIKTLYAGRGRSEGQMPPIVALTASAFAEDKKRYLEAGMDDYLAKPFDKAGLEAVLQRWFGRAAGGDSGAAA